MEEEIYKERVWAKIGGSMIEVDPMWEMYHHREGSDLGVAAYVTGGMYWWPCGRTFQAAGRDGFDENEGEPNCKCHVCSRVEELMGKHADSTPDQYPLVIKVWDCGELSPDSPVPKLRKYKGKKMSDVPKSYWKWLWDKSYGKFGKRNGWQGRIADYLEEHAGFWQEDRPSVEYCD